MDPEVQRRLIDGFFTALPAVAAAYYAYKSNRATERLTELQKKYDAKVDRLRGVIDNLRTELAASRVKE